MKKPKKPSGRPPRKHLTIYRYSGYLCIPVAITQYLLTDYIEFLLNTEDNPYIVSFRSSGKGFKLRGFEHSYKIATIYSVLKRLGIQPKDVAGNEYEWVQNKRNDLFTFDLSKPIKEKLKANGV